MKQVKPVFVVRCETSFTNGQNWEPGKNRDGVAFPEREHELDAEKDGQEWMTREMEEAGDVSGQCLRSPGQRFRYQVERWFVPVQRKP